MSETTNETRVTFNQAMESLMNVTIAGFAGALVGMSLARRRGAGGLMNGSATAIIRTRTPSSSSSSISSTSSATTNGSNTVRNRATPYIDHDLPIQWAVTCLTFSGIVEFSKLSSPSTSIMNLLSNNSNAVKVEPGESFNVAQGVPIEAVDDMPNNLDKNTLDSTTTLSKLEQETDFRIHDENIDDSTTGISPHAKNEILQSWSSSPKKLHHIQSHYEDWTHTAIRLIGDYTIGGAIAGALFKGKPIRTQAAIKLSKLGGHHHGGGMIMPRPSIIAGLIPGATLGFLAGCATFGVEMLRRFAERTLSSDAEEKIGGDVVEAESIRKMDVKVVEKK